MKKHLKDSVFVDKVTARLFFERKSIHLYEMLLEKCPPELAPRFKKILREEQEHAVMLEEVLNQLGANPFKMTPSARVTDIESQGIMKAVKKSSFHDMLDSVLAAELVDTANWEILLMMAKKMKSLPLAQRFKKAMVEEARHLKFIHRYILKDLTGSTRIAELHEPKKAA